jgi:hypothetical protein
LLQVQPAHHIQPAQFSTGTVSGSAAAPANAMQLIKDLRQQSGAPISDVKVKLPGIDWPSANGYQAGTPPLYGKLARPAMCPITL